MRTWTSAPRSKRWRDQNTRPQEVISLSVFIPFAVLYMDQPFKWDYVWAALCMLGAVYFVFRGS